MTAEHTSTQNLAVATQDHLSGCSAPLCPSIEQSCAWGRVHLCVFALRPSCSKVACQNVAVTTAHLFESSAPQWPSRPAGSQHGVMRCQPPVALRGLLAQPLAAHVCTQRERGWVFCWADRLQARKERLVSALPGVPDNSHTRVKSQSWTQSFGILKSSTHQADDLCGQEGCGTKVTAHEGWQT